MWLWQSYMLTVTSWTEFLLHWPPFIGYIWNVFLKPKKSLFNNSSRAHTIDWEQIHDCAGTSGHIACFCVDETIVSNPNNPGPCKSIEAITQASTTANHEPTQRVLPHPRFVFHVKQNAHPRLICQTSLSKNRPFWASTSSRLPCRPSAFLLLLTLFKTSFSVLFSGCSSAHWEKENKTSCL